MRSCKFGGADTHLGQLHIRSGEYGTERLRRVSWISDDEACLRRFDNFHHISGGGREHNRQPGGSCFDWRQRIGVATRVQDKGIGGPKRIADAIG